MAESRIKTPADDIIALPREVLEKLNNAGADELKVLVYRFAEPECGAASAARELGLPQASVESAFAFWRGAGIFTESDKKKKVNHDATAYRNYDSETLSKAVTGDEGYAMVCEFAAKKLGKQLTKNDYSSLYYLYDFVGMPAEVICGVIETCCSEGKASLQYVFRKTVGLYDDGIDTYEKFEQYLARAESVRSDIGRLRVLCGMGERSLTPREQKLFDVWFGEWSTPFELIKLAYEKTVDGTGKLSFSYMNSILKRWHESGYRSAGDVERGESSRKGGEQTSFTEDSFIEAALNRGFGD